MLSFGSPCKVFCVFYFRQHGLISLYPSSLKAAGVENIPSFLALEAYDAHRGH